MRVSQQLQSKRVFDFILVKFNFTSDLAAGEVLNSATVTASVYSGTDSSPSSIISGSDSISGPEVSQLIVDGLEGVIYVLNCEVITNLSQILNKSVFLAVVNISQP